MRTDLTLDSQFMQPQIETEDEMESQTTIFEGIHFILMHACIIVEFKFPLYKYRVSNQSLDDSGHSSSR